jgi:uncharacterized repeat protein (TIGR02543 family)
VKFDSKGGSSVANQSVTSGGSIAAAPSSTKSFALSDLSKGLYKGDVSSGGSYTLDGWYTAANGGGTKITFPYTPTDTVTLYANWTGGPQNLITVTTDPINDAITWLGTHAEASAYTVVLDGNVSTGGLSFDTSSVGSATEIILTGTQESTISYSGVGYVLFVNNSNLNLVLGSNITITATGVTESSPVYILDGTFTMLDGAKISDCKASTNHSYSAGVYDRGTFLMQGGTISGNQYICADSPNAGAAGGVYIETGATFKKTGGVIENNTCTNTGSEAGQQVYRDNGASTYDIDASIPVGTDVSTDNTASPWKMAD